MSTATIVREGEGAGLKSGGFPGGRPLQGAQAPTPTKIGLMGLVATRPVSLTLSCILSALSALVGLAPALLVFAIAKQVLSQSPNLDEVLWLAGIGLACALLKPLLFGLSTCLAHVAAFGILYDLRVRIAKKMANVPLGFFSKRRLGSLHKAMSEDVQGIEAFLAHMLPDGVAAMTVPFGAMALMFYVDWRMALAAFAAVPIALMFQLSMFFGEDNQAAYERYHRVTEDTKGAVHDYLRGIHVVKAFGLEARSFTELRDAVDGMTAYVDEYARRSAPPMIAAMKLMGGGTNALFIIPAGVWLYSEGTLDTATFVFFLVVSTQVLSPFLRIANVAGQLQLLLKGVENIEAILGEVSLPEGTASLPLGDRRVAFKDVGFAYQETPVLQNVSFEMLPGTVTAIVGPSGAGKSTLAKLLPRFWDVNSGGITVGGVDLRSLRLDAWLGEVSLVFQDVFLFDGSVAENLRIAKSDATLSELVEVCKKARIHSLIASLPQGYDTPLGEGGARLSGGERQRISIARAFLKNAPLLILDEATAFADALSESKIQDALAELSQSKTVMVIAHKLSTITRADNIVVLDGGKVVDQGKHEALLGRCPLYQGLWESYSGSENWALPAMEVQS